jgi:tryptophanyl-tRNA synthetase
MPTKTGIYTEEDAKNGHLFSRKLCDAMSDVFRKEIPIVDLGCGLGTYVYHYNNIGYNAIGVDGIKVENSSNSIIIKDLTQSFDLGIKGNVICLEVGEHIPIQYEDVLFENIFKHCDEYCILSWAVEGQIGIGHINCKNNDYVIEKFEKNNFKYDDKLTIKIRSDIEDYCNYFRNTLMVFKKNG